MSSQYSPFLTLYLYSTRYSSAFGSLGHSVVGKVEFYCFFLCSKGGEKHLLEQKFNKIMYILKWKKFQQIFWPFMRIATSLLFNNRLPNIRTCNRHSCRRKRNLRCKQFLQFRLVYDNYYFHRLPKGVFCCSLHSFLGMLWRYIRF